MTGPNLWRKYRTTFLVFFTLLITIFFIFYFQVDYLSTSDEQLSQYSVLNLNNYSNLKIYDSLNNNYSTCIFSTYALSLINGRTYPTFPSSEILFYLPFGILFGDNFLIFVAYLFAILSLVLICIITRKLTNNLFSGIISMLIFSLSPSFLKWSVGFLNIMPAIFFFLLVTYFIFVCKNEYKFLFAGLALSYLLMIRPSELPFVILSLLIMYLQKTKTRDYYFFIIPLLLFVVNTFLANYLFFGDFSTFPQLYGNDYSCLNNDASDSFIFQIKEYFEFNNNLLQAIIFHIKFSILNSSFAFPLLYPAAIFLIFSYKEKKNFVLFVLFVWITLVMTYGRGIGNYYGFGQENLQSSFIRYLFYLFGLLSIGIGLYFKKFLSKFKYPQKIIIIFFMVLLLTLSTLYTYSYSSNGINDYNKKRIYQQNVATEISKEFNSKDIVITEAYTSKLIEIKSNIPQIQFDEPFAYIEPNISLIEFNRVLSIVVENNESIYFLGQRKYNFTEYLIQDLTKKYDLDKKNSYVDGLIEVYKINKKLNFDQSLTA